MRIAWGADSGVIVSRLLRRADQNFAGPDDPDAFKLFEGEPADSPVTDITVSDGQAYFYKDYGSEDGVTFTDDDGAPQSATPAALYQDGTVDVRGLLAARFRAGFAQEIRRGLLKIKAREGATTGEVSVKNAPPALQEVNWPTFTIHLDIDTQAERALGEDITGKQGDQSEGFLAHYGFALESFSQNPDERAALHQSISRILKANLPVFADFGLVNVEWDAKDEDFMPPQSPWGVPVYVSSYGFRCKAPAFIYTDPDDAEYGVIEDISVSAIAYANQQVKSLP